MVSRGAASAEDWQACFERALQRRLDAGLGAGGRLETSAYRLAHGEADGAPGWVVDVYDRWLVAQSYADGEADDGEAAVLDGLAALPFEGVYLKRRPRQANVVDDREREQRAPAVAVRGADAPEALCIREHGVGFEARLGEGFSTGLFLDQRGHRKHLRESARGRVLNLFAYTCGFGVAAALGGAETVNVDLAKRSLEWGKRNYALNGVELEGHRFLARDAFDYLARAERKEEPFDVVVLDPPSYARGRKQRFNASRDYVALCASALRLVRSGGRLLACTNQQGLLPARFETELAEAASRAGVALTHAPRVAPLEADFPLKKGAIPHLKACWLELSGPA